MQTLIPLPLTRHTIDTDISLCTYNALCRDVPQVSECAPFRRAATGRSAGRPAHSVARPQTARCAADAAPEVDPSRRTALQAAAAVVAATLTGRCPRCHLYLPLSRPLHA